MKSLLFAASLALLGASLVLAQQNRPSPDAASSNPGRYAELAKAPEKARARNNPLEHDPEAVPAGQNLFDQHCSECHGSTAEGGKKGPNHDSEPVQQASWDTLFWILTNGVVRRGMPVWSKLPEPQRWQLVSYLKSLTPTDPPGPDGQEKPKP